MLRLFIIIQVDRILSSVERVGILINLLGLVAYFVGLSYHAVHSCIEDVLLVFVDGVRDLAFLELLRDLVVLIGAAQMYTVELLMQWCLLLMLGAAVETR